MMNPINRNYGTVLIDTIPTCLIINKYMNQFGQDVSKYFVGMNEVSIFECSITKYRFYYPFTLVGDGDFYEVLSVNKKEYYHNRWEHFLALNYSESSTKWMEVGSGNSYFLRKLVDRGVDAIGLELNENEVKLGLRDNLKILNKDFFSFQNEDDKFDVIALFQVLEHMYMISDFFKKSNELLKPKGRIIFSVPNSNPYLFLFDKYHTLNLPPHHMGLWNVKSVKLVGDEFGFKVIDIETEILSHSEFEYIINFKNLKELFSLNVRIAFLKLFYILLPGRLKVFWSKLCRSKFLEGRNIFVVLEKI